MADESVRAEDSYAIDEDGFSRFVRAGDENPALLDVAEELEEGEE